MSNALAQKKGVVKKWKSFLHSPFFYDFLMTALQTMRHLEGGHAGMDDKGFGPCGNSEPRDFLPPLCTMEV